MIKQIIKGLATFIPGVYPAFSRRRTGGTDSARYCYSVWLRFLVLSRNNNFPTNPKIIAELGPGDSIGIGLAALIAGAEKYYAFDVVDYANLERNLTVYDELVMLFKNEENIPGVDEFPQVIPLLDSYAFPRDILTSDRLSIALNDDRLELIRRSIIEMNNNDSLIHYKVPWYKSDIIEEDSIDMIFSQAVLEHVNDPYYTYLKMYSWLKPGGFMSHSIDFRCHGYADDWNGHWKYSDLTWKLIVGKRPYLLNRLPHSQHLKYLNEVGFKVKCDLIYRLPSKIDSVDLAQGFKYLDDDDLTASTAFIQAVK
jgi:SAM-dependent methyltransferase